MTATEIRYHETMPDSAYDMWVRGENAGSYKTMAAWSFGGEITFPEPFEFTVDAAEWKPWQSSELPEHPA